MPRDLVETQKDAQAALQALGLKVGPDALKPLRFVDFKKLVDIHDHEERFLFDSFVTGVVATHAKRVRRAPIPSHVTAADVRKAMLNLGETVARASGRQMAARNKTSVKDACPYC